MQSAKRIHWWRRIYHRIWMNYYAGKWATATHEGKPTIKWMEKGIYHALAMYPEPLFTTTTTTETIL